MRKRELPIPILILVLAYTLTIVLFMAPAALAAVPSPSVTITAPASGATVSGNVAIAATCASGGSSYTITRVYYQIGSTSAPKIDMNGTLGGTSGNFTANWDSTTVANGSKKIYVGCTNSGNKTTTKNITVTVNNVAGSGPTVAITAPANGATVAGDIPINATCTAPTGKTISSVVYQIDGGAPVTMTGPTGSATGTWTNWWNTTGVANGSHTIKVTATDSSAGTGSNQITVTVNNPVAAQPTLTIVAPAANATVSGSNVSIIADATGGGSYTVTDVSYKIDSGAYNSMAGPDGTVSGTWTGMWDTTFATNASHTITVQVTNSASQVLTKTVNITVSNPTGTVSVQAVTNKYKYGPSNVVTVKAVAMRGLYRLSSSRISSQTVTIKDPANKTVVNAAVMTKEGTGLCLYNYTIPSSPVKGIYTVTVTIKDTSTTPVTGTGTATFKVQLPVYNHASAFSTYQGTKTCITSACHSTQANAMFGSLHYQWRGDNVKAIELAGSNPKISKNGGINNYCVWAEGNWIGTMTNLDDTKNVKCGCAWCHAGLGLKPTTVSSTAQLENIDCLICHSPTYKRIVQTNPDGTFVMVPDPTIDIQAAAKNIQRPNRTSCLNCHKNAGGGDNNKRGDLDSTLAACTGSYDVHMGTNGQNFTCQDCHKTEGHKMAGRGTDMRAVDLNFDMSCETCHTKRPHRTTNANYSRLNAHADRVNCTVCHIPTYAKAVSTDMYRDWTRVDPNSAANRYDPYIERGQNLRPSYEWFNTFSHFYKFKDQVTYAANGRVKMAYPDGAFVDITGRPMAKLFPYKIHVCNQPKNNAAGNAFDNMLLPLRNKIVFETGNINMAITEGCNAANVTYNGHTFVQTESYQSIHHTVGPKSTALSCTNGYCHSTSDTRIPFESIGYQRRGTDTQLCDVCHSMESRPSFTSLHGEHGERINCAACHGNGYPLKEPKSTLCDNCHSMKTFTTADYIHQRHVRSSSAKDCANCHTFSRYLDAAGTHTEYHD